MKKQYAELGYLRLMRELEALEGSVSPAIMDCDPTPEQEAVWAEYIKIVSEEREMRAVWLPDENEWRTRCDAAGPWPTLRVVLGLLKGTPAGCRSWSHFRYLVQRLDWLLEVAGFTPQEPDPLPALRPFRPLSFTRNVRVTHKSVEEPEPPLIDAKDPSFEF